MAENQKKDELVISRSKLTMDQISALPGAIDVRNCQNDEEVKRIVELWKQGLEERLQKKGIVEPPFNKDMWPSQQYFNYMYMSDLYSEYDGNGDLAFIEAVKNAHMHGNRYTPNFPVRVVGGWSDEKFYFAIQDGGKGVADSLNRPGQAFGRSEGGLAIVLSWGGRDSYVDINSESHTLFLVRDLDTVEETKFSSDPDRQKRLQKEFSKLRKRVVRGLPLELVLVKKEGAD